MRKHKFLSSLLAIFILYIIISFIFLIYVITGHFTKITYTNSFTTSSTDKIKIETFQNLIKNCILIPTLIYISPQYKFDNVKYTIKLNGTINATVALPLYGNCIKINGLKYIALNKREKKELYDLFYKLPPSTPQKLSDLIGSNKFNKMELHIENKTYIIKSISNVKKFFNDFGILEFKNLQKKYIPKDKELLFSIRFSTDNTNKNLYLLHIIKTNNQINAIYNDMFMSCESLTIDDIKKMLNFFGIKDISNKLIH